MTRYRLTSMDDYGQAVQELGVWFNSVWERTTVSPPAKVLILEPGNEPMLQMISSQCTSRSTLVGTKPDRFIKTLLAPCECLDFFTLGD